jgi:hypothetical protein
MPFKNNFRPGETRTCITLNGAGDEYLDGVSFSNVHVTYGGGGTREEASRTDVPKMAGEYFELGTLPAYGLWARNVRRLSMTDVRFEVEKADVRPAVVFERVEDCSINGLAAQGNPNAESLLRFKECRDVLISGARVLTPVPAFLRMEGLNEGIKIDGGDTTKAPETLVTK